MLDKLYFSHIKERGICGSIDFSKVMEHQFVPYLCAWDQCPNVTLFSVYSFRMKLITAEVAKYRAGLACAPMHFFQVTYNKHTLTLDDLSTLDDQNWVNDQVSF